MLKIKLQYFGHLMQRVDWFEKTLMLGKIEGRRRRGWDFWMSSPTQWVWVWVDFGSWWWTGRPGVLRFLGLPRVRHDSATELNWTKISNLGMVRKTHRLSGSNLISCLNGREFSQLVAEVRFEAWNGFSPSLLAVRWKWPCDQEYSWAIKPEDGLYLTTWKESRTSILQPQRFKLSQQSKWAWM